MAKQTFTTGQVLTAAQMTSLQQTAMGGGSTTAKTTSYVLVAADAGTVVQMNAAGATTITVNTALFAAGDTVQIQNVGAGVCTITAGTATVNTSSTLALKQYDAGSLYFNSTSAAIFFAVDAADSTSPLTTKGDLFTYSTADARLAVGNNGESLVADSGTATGLRYQANTSAGKNGLINGAFTISQRGATIAGINTDNTYTADRWYITRGGVIDYAQKTVAGGSTPPANFDAYAQYINQTAANAFITINQAIETVNSVRFANKVVTFSFYARAAANTAKSKSLTAGVYYSTSDNTKPTTTIGDTTFTLLYGTTAADWTFCTLTATVPSTARTVSVRYTSAPVGGLAVGDGYEITGTMLEIGSVATAFQTATGNQASELAACQRYYYRSSSTNLYGAVGTGIATGLTAGTFLTSLPVAMRVVPTTIDFSTLQVYSSTVALAVSALTLNTSTTTTTIGGSTSTHANATTADYFYILRGANSASAYIAFNAEL